MKPPEIPAGQTTIPRQYAAFPDWRSAMLAALAEHPALSGWRGRGKDDLGLMLLEMWACVCDVVSFYDEVIAHETYLRTARLRPSLRRLVEILGYIPRPAVAARVALSAFADGKKPVDLPPGVSFRSGAFGSSPPQVFELDQATTIHPSLNQLAVKQVFPSHLAAGTHSHLLLAAKGIKVRQGDLLLFVSPFLTAIRRAGAISPCTGEDGLSYKRIELRAGLVLETAVPMSELKLLIPTAVGSLWRFNTATGDQATITVAGGRTTIYLDGQYPNIHANDYVLLAKDDDVRWFKVTGIAGTMRKLITGLVTPVYDKDGNPAGTVASPDISVPVTRLTLDAAVNDDSRKSRVGLADWYAADAPNLALHYGLVPAGEIRVEAKASLSREDNFIVTTPRLDPGLLPQTFLVEDSEGKGVLASGSLNVTTGNLDVDQSTVWTGNLEAPLSISGNVLTATRGETVKGEVLGYGDASRKTQRFKLKKKPLTYVPVADGSSEQGIKSTLTVRVDGVLWQEVRSFFGSGPDDQVYVARQNDEEEAEVLFGGGARPATGARIVADYRYGAGAAMPPAGSIHQLAKPVPGLKSIRNPVPAYGGDDAEAAKALSRYAPRSALLLGRVVSIQDMEVAAATVSGVRAASAVWRWNHERQQPVAQITYIGDPALREVISQKLLSLSDPATPISVTRAAPVVARIELEIEIDGRLGEADVIAAVRATLVGAETGMLCPERIGISTSLFRSKIFEKVLSVAGVLAMRSLLVNGSTLPDHGIAPPAGCYFDFENGTVNVGVVYG